MSAGRNQLGVSCFVLIGGHPKRVRSSVQLLELETTPIGTRLVHSERFRGVLVRFMRKMVDSGTRQGFEEMNAALKTRAEAQSGNQS